MTTTTIASLNRWIQKSQRKDLTKLFASYQPNACNAKASSWPSPVERCAQTCGRYRCRRRRCGGRKSQRQTCTTNQQKSQIEIRTITTNTAAPNYNSYLKYRKTYSCDTDTSKNNSNRTYHHHGHSSCDDNFDCINTNNNTTIDTNKADWYVRLASNCYRNGFQLHVNHLDEWSKHPCLIQRKPPQVPSFLRLPSSALQAIRSYSVASEKSCISHNQSISTNRDVVVNASNIITQPPTIRERINSNKSDSKNVLNDCILRKNPQQQPNDIERIYVKNLLEPSDTHHSNRPIDDSSKLPIIDTKQNQQHQQGDQQLQHNIGKIKQFNTPNAKNTMNSVAIDANIHLQSTVNRQLSCQAIQINYQNNNLTFDREFYAGAEQFEPHSIVTEDSIATSIGGGVLAATAANGINIANPGGILTSSTILSNCANNNNNNQHHHRHHWLHENHSNAIVPTHPNQSIVTRPTATNDIDIDDLIKSFSAKFDVTDPTQRHKLPQIVLSDFSNNQLLSSPPPTTPLLTFSMQSTHTLSEQPEQLQELQQFFYQPANTQ